MLRRIFIILSVFLLMFLSLPDAVLAGQDLPASDKVSTESYIVDIDEDSLLNEEPAPDISGIKEEEGEAVPVPTEEDNPDVNSVSAEVPPEDDSVATAAIVPEAEFEEEFEYE